MTVFMPAKAGDNFEERGGWAIQHLMADLDLTAEEAAGIVGNLGGESGMTAINEKHPMVSGSRGGFGWAQWTGSRRVTFEQWCINNQLNQASDVANYGFLLYELRGSQSHVIDQLKKCTTVEAAVYTVEVIFERPADTQGGLADRNEFAQRALDGYEDLAGPVATVPPVPAPRAAQPDPPVVVIPAPAVAVVPGVPPIPPAPAPAPVAVPVFPVGAMEATVAARAPWWTLPGLGVLVILMFMSVLLAAAYMHNDALLTQMTPYLTAGFVMTLGYFFGSSAGSAKKDDTAQITALKVP
jgi:hypothetical protein